MQKDIIMLTNINTTAFPLHVMQYDIIVLCVFGDLY